MLIGLIILAIYILSALYAAYSGSAAQAGSAVLEGAGAAVSFCISIGGAVCLWSAVAELLERSGAAAWLSRLLRPVLIRLFPDRAGQSCHRRPVGERQRESPRPRQRRNARRDPCRQGHGAPWRYPRAG